MSTRNTTSFKLGVALLTLGLAACSTPQEARESADFAVGMVTQLETQLRQFRLEQEFSAEQRLRALRAHEATLLKVMAAQNKEARIRQTIGITGHQAVAQRLQELAEVEQASETELQAALKDLDAQVQALLKSLPDTAKTSADTAKALGEMGAELPLSVRAVEFRAAVEAVRQTVDDLKKKAESPPSAASAAAPTLPASAASAP